MRSPSLVKRINALTSKDFKQVTISRSGRHNKPKVAESASVKLTSYPGTVRQLIITGLGRDAPTVIITNDNEITTRALIEHYARRMTIEQRLAEIIQAFCADALSSAVNLNVDLDVVLCVLAQALTAAFRLRLPGNYAHATPPPSSAASPAPPARSSATAPASPSRSTAAPTHPSSAKPTCPPTPPSPGGTDACSTSNSPDQGPKYRCGNPR
jgi:hypothetical protein